MKKLLLLATIVFLSSFATRLYYEIQQNSAEVNQEQGLHIFVDSKPLKKYQYLGTIKTPWWSGDPYHQIKGQILKKIRKEYPNSNGVIMNLGTGANCSADAILLEE